MEPALRVALEAVHASPMRAVVHVTGGAAQSLGWVMAVPGASRTLLDARVPYARESMVDTLGAEPKQYVSAQTARDLARTAYTRGVRLSPGVHHDDHRHVVGVGCTCALASVPPKKGDHRCFVATYGVLGSATYELNMEKGLRDRWEEDGLASRLVVQALADAAAEAETRERERRGESFGKDCANGANGDGAANAIPWEGVLSANDAMTTTRAPTRSPDDPISWVTSGSCDVAAFSTETGELTSLHAIPPRTVILPGSFNPAHEGHRQMLAAAAALRPGHALAFELAVTNADKGTLEPAEVRTTRGFVLFTERRGDGFLRVGNPRTADDVVASDARASVFAKGGAVPGRDVRRRARHRDPALDAEVLRRRGGDAPRVRGHSEPRVLVRRRGARGDERRGGEDVPHAGGRRRARAHPRRVRGAAGVQERRLVHGNQGDGRGVGTVRVLDDVEDKKRVSCTRNAGGRS
jgi:hypothetical protein